MKGLEAVQMLQQPTDAGGKIMRQAGYIGLDVGTSGCKASVLDGEGRVLATASREYGFEYPAGGMVELNPSTVWNCVKDTLREIASSGHELRMLSVSSIGEAMVMLDREDRVLHNGITYLDERGPESVDTIRERIGGDRMHRITGLPPRLFYSLNRFLWLQENHPEIVEQTDKFFLFGDYITYMLTGERLIDPGSASKTWMLDRTRLDWSEEIGSAFGVPLGRFSAVVPTGTRAGTVRPQVAQETGLPETLQVVVGCHDQVAATLGSGCVRRGEMAAGEGSTESLNLVAGREDITDRFYDLDICLEPYVIPDTYMIPVGQHSHGTSIRWFVKQFGADFGPAPAETDGAARSIYEIANDNCAADSEEVYFLPHLTRSHLMDPANRSLGLFTGLKVSTGRAVMYRALLEGICFESKLCFDRLLETGFPIDRIVATGGCSKSALLMQMKADILGRPVGILEDANAGISALAMICAVSEGAYGTYGEAAGVFARIRKEYAPQRDYSEKYRRYVEIYEAAKKLY